RAARALGLRGAVRRRCARRARERVAFAGAADRAAGRAPWGDRGSGAVRNAVRRLAPGADRDPGHGRTRPRAAGAGRCARLGIPDQAGAPAGPARPDEPAAPAPLLNGIAPGMARGAEPVRHGGAAGQMPLSGSSALTSTAAWVRL